VSVALNVGTTPETALFEASLRVTVTVDVAVPSATTGVVPVIDEFAATADPGVNTTVVPALTTGVRIERTLDSAFVEARVHVAIPDAFVEEHVPYVFVVPVSVAPKVGTVPTTGLLEASFKVIVTVEFAVPSATTGVVPEILELAATAAAAVKTTELPALTTGVAIERVFDSAVFDLRVQVETPEALVEEQALMTLVEPVSVALNVGTVPDTKLLFASLSVIVIVEEAVPSATTGVVPVIEEFTATAAPAVKTAVPPAFTTGVAIERTFDSALVEARVHVEIPDASVDEQVPYVFVVPVSVAPKVGTIPETALFEASFKVIVTVEVAIPSATTGVVPVILELTATADPGVKTTVEPALTTGVAIERTFDSAFVEERVQVEIPEALDEEHVP
jgi:hypothetical protein